MKVRAHAQPPLVSEPLLISDDRKVHCDPPIQLTAWRTVVPPGPFATQHLDAGDRIAHRRATHAPRRTHAIGMAYAGGVQSVAAVSESEPQIEVVAICERLVKSAELDR